MIVQAIGLLDDLDKELNTYAMRVREWYGWHFPEMTRVVTDNIQYALAVGFLPLVLSGIASTAMKCCSEFLFTVVAYFILVPGACCSLHEGKHTVLF
jgi:hypothetical protein